MSKKRIIFVLTILLILVSSFQFEAIKEKQGSITILQDGLYHLLSEDGNDTLGEYYLTDEKHQFPEAKNGLEFHQKEGVVLFIESAIYKRDFNQLTDYQRLNNELSLEAITKYYKYEIQVQNNGYLLSVLDTIPDGLFLKSKYMLKESPKRTTNFDIDQCYLKFGLGDIILTQDSLYVKRESFLDKSISYCARTLTTPEKICLSNVFQKYHSEKDKPDSQQFGCFAFAYYEVTIGDTIRTYNNIAVNKLFYPIELKEIALADSNLFNPSFKKAVHNRLSSVLENYSGKKMIDYGSIVPPKD